MKIIVKYRRKQRPGMTMRITKSGDVSISASPGVTRGQIHDFVESHRDWIAQALMRRMEDNEKRKTFYDQLPLETTEQQQQAQQRLLALIPPFIEKYEMEMGVKVAAVTFKATRSRWGSCNHRTRRINLSVYLLLLPDWCAEHVVVHEMAHLIVPNHSAVFYAVMDRHFPRWREARAETRRIVQNAKS